jgi:spermidine dehydrogenase
MKHSDKLLGMNRSITRRDVLFGAASLSLAPLLSSPVYAAESPNLKGSDLITATYYPPGLMEMRGNHEGSFEVAHSLARQRKTDWGPAEEASSDIYDLIVVGGGISGLSAAYFFREKIPGAKILILDNHDDFGGHAKRNEFDADGHQLIGYGGSQTMQEPSGYSHIVKKLLKDLKIDPGVFDTAYDHDFFKRNKLRAGIHFNNEMWGVRKTVAYDLGVFDDYIPVMPSELSAEQAVQQMPISESAKAQFLHVLSVKDDQIPHLKGDAKWDYLYRLSYQDFLITHLNVTEPEVFKVLQDLHIDSGVGIDSVNTVSAMSYGGLPGWSATGLPEQESDEPYIHHFPDGNASIARQLVRDLIPEVAAGSSVESLLHVKFDYSKLDSVDSNIKVRLNSTAVSVKNIPSMEGNDHVRARYIKNGRHEQVTGKSAILACNSSMIPHLSPDLPRAQREALAFQTKVPILYTSVALRNWKAWKKLGLGAVVCPGGYHINALLDFPVSFGGYKFSANENEAVIVHMERFPHRYGENLTAKEQYRLGRYELLTTPFEVIERNVRDQLQSLLGDGGFDAAEDIVGITVNRWSHGYSYWYNSLFDPVYEDDEDPRYPHIIGRQTYGRIAIANADSAANAMLESAIEQAHRAVNELV